MSVNELPTTLTEGRLVLRPPRDTDIDALVAACQDPEISRWTRVPSPYGRSDAVAFLEMAARENHEHVGQHYVVVNLSDTLVGACGIHHAEPERATTEVGYWIAAPARGQGVATAALTAITRAALAVGYQRIAAEVLCGNESSRRVLERVGYLEEGILRSVHAGGCGDSSDRVDVHLYSLIGSDPAARALLG